MTIIMLENGFRMKLQTTWRPSPKKDERLFSSNFLINQLIGKGGSKSSSRKISELDQRYDSPLLAHPKTKPHFHILS